MADFVLVARRLAWRLVLAASRPGPLVGRAPRLRGDAERRRRTRPYSRRELTLETHIDDVAGVIEAEELRGAMLVGHSYGGMVSRASPIV